MTHFLDDLQRQFVAASRRLAPTPRTAPWRRSVRRGTPLLIAVLLVTASGVAATTQVFGDRNESLRVIDRLANIPEGQDHRWVRANGLDPARAGLAFTTPHGLRVDAISAAHATCIMVSDGDDQCYRATTIPFGRGFSIGNNCTVGGDRRMRIAGAAPADTTRLHVKYSAGAGLTTNVIDGVFLIDTKTPAEDEPYPTTMRFLDPRGATIVTQDIGNGNHLCLDGRGS